MSAGLALLGVACGPVDHGGQTETSAEQEQVQRQGLTSITKTFTWSALAANKHCKFGDASLGHQAPTNGYASGRKEEAITVTGLAGQRIVSLRLRTPSAASASFKYDDVMLINYGANVLMASDRRAAQYSAGAAAGSIGTTAVAYSWPAILNGDIRNQESQPAWCAPGASECSVPPTETVGTMNVYIPDFKAEDELAYPSAPDSRTFTLVTIGDNDDGTYNGGYQTKDTDCVHGEIQAEVILTTEPAVAPPRAKGFALKIQDLTALHPDCTAEQFALTSSYSMHCIAAAHRFCVNNGFEGGLPTELSLPDVNVDCFRGTGFPEVPITDLTAHHPDCNVTYLQGSIVYGRGCHAAASRYCSARGLGSGVLQEILAPITSVVCSNPASTTYLHSVPHSTWMQSHPYCSLSGLGHDVSRECRAAARRYCINNVPGGVTGFPVEWGLDIGALFCALR